MPINSVSKTPDTPSPLRSLAVDNAQRGPYYCLHILALGALLSCLSPNVDAQQSSNLSLLFFDPVPVSDSFPLTSDLPEEAALLSKDSADAFSLVQMLATGSPESQEDKLVRLEEDRLAYESQLDLNSLEHNAYSAELTEDLTALGDVYSGLGLYEQALEMYEEALHRVRVNSGLYSLEQETLIGKITATYLARGDIAAANEKQVYLYYIAQKHYGTDTPELIPSLRRLQGWNLQQYQQVINEAGGSYHVNPNHLGPYNTIRLVNARNVLLTIESILLSQEELDSAALISVYEDMARVHYLFSTTNDIRKNAFEGPQSDLYFTRDQVDFIGSGSAGGNMGYRSGRDALENRLSLIRARGDTGDTVRAMQMLGDWHLLFKHPNSAQDVYLQAWRFAMDQTIGDSAGQIKQWFQPLLPQELPLWVAIPYSREALNIPADLQIPYRGYIDVRFQIRSSGTVRGLELISQQSNADSVLAEEVAAQLLTRLRYTRYRPPIGENGEFNPDQEFQIRYYYTY